MRNVISTHRNELVIALIVVLNFVLGLFSLSLSPIGIDEPFSIFHAQKDIPDIILSLKGDNNPPLFEIILHGWIKLFGISPISVRFPSLVFSTATLVVAYLVLRRIATSRLALLSVIFLSISNYYVYFTHEARAYSLFLFLAALSFYLVIRITEHKGKNIGELIAWWLTMSLMLYAHYFGIFVVFSQCAYFLIINRSNSLVIKMFAAIWGAVILAYSPYLPEVYDRFMVSSQSGTWVKPTENIGNLHDLIFWFANQNKYIYLLFILLFYGAAWKLCFNLHFHQFLKHSILFLGLPLLFLTSFSIYFDIPFIWRLTSSDVYTTFFVLFVLSLFLFVFFQYPKAQPFHPFVIGSFLLPLLVFFVVSFRIPIWVDRYLVFTVPFFYSSLALAIEFLFKKTYFYLVSALCIGAMTFTYNLATTDHNNVDQLANYVREAMTDESIIIINPKPFDLTFMYHYDQQTFSNFTDFPNALQAQRIYSVYSHVDLEGIADSSFKHIIYIDAYADFQHPQNGVHAALNSKYDLQSDQLFWKSIHVYEFSK